MLAIKPEPDAPSTAATYYLRHLIKTLAITKEGRPWPQRAAIIDAEVALSKMQATLEREGVVVTLHI